MGNPRPSRAYWIALTAVTASAYLMVSAILISAKPHRIATSATQASVQGMPLQTAPSAGHGPDTETRGSSTQGWLLYQNPAFGYSFQYPPTWFVSASSDSAQFLKSTPSQFPQSDSTSTEIGNDGATFVVESWGPTSIASERNFDEFASSYLQQLCVAGTDENPTYPNSVATEVTSTNANGILYVKVYFNAVVDNGPDASTTSAGFVGPIYGFYIWPETHGLANMLVLWPSALSSEICRPSSLPREESSEVRNLIGTLKF